MLKQSQVVAAWLSALVCAYTGAAAAAAPNPSRSSLEEVVVTGIREDRLWHVPKNVSVLDVEDIALAPSNNLIDLLAREANITLRTFTGNDKRGGVDIRGMGDTFTSNVLVLLDGVKQNASDLSGADYSSIALADVERIEVIRGGGAVRYGGGAVGGVVNIITSTPDDGLTGSVRAYGASENSQSAAFKLAATNDWAGVQLTASDYDTDGYRDNGNFEKQDVSLSLDFQLTPSLATGLIGRYHRDEYGLPGPVSRDTFLNGSDSDRRKTSTPNDRGETADDRLYWTVDFTPVDTTHNFHWQSFIRDRNNPYQFGTLDSDKSEIIEDSKGASLIYENTEAFKLQGLRFSLGGEYFTSDYQRQENIYRTVDNSANYAGMLEQHAAFVTLQYQASPKLIFDIGYRYDVTRIDQKQSRPVSVYVDTFVEQTIEIEQTIIVEQIQYIDIGGGVTIPVVVEVPVTITVPVVIQVPSREKVGETTRYTQIADDHWYNDAVELGVVYAFSDQQSIFASFMRGFRNPNVDELLLTPEPNNTQSPLMPQTNTHWDIGYRWLSGALSFTASLYQIDIEDEILFGRFEVESDSEEPSFIDVNFNANQETRRRGIELQARWFIHRAFTLSGNWSYTKARFRETSTHIPLVPEISGSVGVEWQPLEETLLALNANYVGERYDGNAFGTTQSNDQLIDSYYTVDLKLIQSWDDWRLSGGINNLLDEVYASSVYSGNYYPNPGRNLYASIEFTF